MYVNRVSHSMRRYEKFTRKEEIKVKIQHTTTTTATTTILCTINKTSERLHFLVLNSFLYVVFVSCVFRRRAEERQALTIFFYFLFFVFFLCLFYFAQVLVLWCYFQRFCLTETIICSIEIAVCCTKQVRAVPWSFRYCRLSDMKQKQYKCFFPSIQHFSSNRSIFFTFIFVDFFVFFFCNCRCETVYCDASSESNTFWWLLSFFFSLQFR